MNEKFKNLTLDAGTTLIQRTPVKIGGFDAVHEQWRWDGIGGESAVFVTEEVKDLGRDTIEAMVREHFPDADCTAMTFTRGKEFTFVNFNFRD